MTIRCISVVRRPLFLALLLVACDLSGVPTPTTTPTASSTSPDVAATAPPSQAAPETAGCPVTLPASSWVAELAGVRPLPASRFSWYGDIRVLAVDLPIDGVYRIASQGSDLSAKVPWWRYVGGVVEITARRADGTAPEGCWRVTGSLQGHELTFVMLVRRAAPGESAP